MVLIREYAYFDYVSLISNFSLAFEIVQTGNVI